MPIYWSRLPVWFLGDWDLWLLTSELSMSPLARRLHERNNGGPGARARYGLRIRNDNLRPGGIDRIRRDRRVRMKLEAGRGSA
jgi:hypothetical protein